MNTSSTDFACLVTGFLTDYLPYHITSLGATHFFLSTYLSHLP